MVKMYVSFPKLFNQDVLFRVLTEGAEGLAELLKEDFEKTVKSWARKPEFQIKMVKIPEGTMITVFTEDDIYEYVTRGTKPHVIVPKRAKNLVFKGSYRAQTTPGVLDSNPGGNYGALSYRKRVMHPGIKAREFEETLAEKYGEIAPKEAHKAVRKAILTAGFRFV